MSRSPIVRVLTVAVLLVQGGAAVGIPWADALVEADAAGIQTHVEARSDTPCSSGHDHLTCQLCRVIGVTSLPLPATQAAWQTPATVRFAPPTDPALDLATRFPRGRGPRAPPIA